MVSIKALLEELKEDTIAQKVALPNDEARISYILKKNTVEDFDEFSWIIGDYYNHHFTKCISRGGSLPASEAIGRAKEILNSEYRRRGGDVVNAFKDAYKARNGGLRSVLDTIADNIKAESVERYILDVFDRHVTPNSWDKKVEIIRQFINETGIDNNSSIDKDRPEQYAHEYQELIRSYIDGLKRTTTILDRL